jgi:hypothetical protein
MTKQLDRDDREVLEAKLKKYREDPDSTLVADNLNKDETKEPDIESQASKVQTLIDEYGNIVTLADEIATIIETRAKDVKVTFNPDQDITLRDSIRRVFGLDTDVVTYAMYKECLQLKEELAKEDREALKET